MRDLRNERYRARRHRVRYLSFALLAAMALPAQAATIAVSPAAPLADERIHIAISGLAPSRPVTVESDTRAQDGLHWRARAVFAADARGAIDLDTAKPVSGSYRGADAMGLFWSALPADGPPGADRAFFAISDFSRPLVTTISVRDGHSVSRTTVTRRFASAQVTSRVMRNGVLFAPKDGRAHPGVLVIGGSDGGLGAPGTAMLFAAHGYAALSLAYFGSKGLPATLERVPMETFAAALGWMRLQPDIDGRFIAIYGESRGTEPALWAAARDAGVAAVVARSPSFVLWGGISANHMPGDAAWTWRGEPLPYIANHITFGFGAGYLWNRLIGTPVRQSDLFLRNLADHGPTDDVEIPVERIHGPVLLLAGKDDAIWPSHLMAQHIMARLGRFQHPYSDALAAYDGAGHPIPYAYLPAGGERQGLVFAVGGTQAGTARAEADAWPRILAFLHRACEIRATGARCLAGRGGAP